MLLHARKLLADSSYLLAAAVSKQQQRSRRFHFLRRAEFVSLRFVPPRSYASFATLLVSREETRAETRLSFERPCACTSFERRFNPFPRSFQFRQGTVRAHSLSPKYDRRRLLDDWSTVGIDTVRINLSIIAVILPIAYSNGNCCFFKMSRLNCRGCWPRNSLQPVLMLHAINLCYRLM